MEAPGRRREPSGTISLPSALTTDPFLEKLGGGSRASAAGILWVLPGGGNPVGRSWGTCGPTRLRELCQAAGHLWFSLPDPLCPSPFCCVCQIFFFPHFDCILLLTTFPRPLSLQRRLGPHSFPLCRTLASLGLGLQSLDAAASGSCTDPRGFRIPLIPL